MKKSVNGVIIDMTPEEIEASKAEEDHYEKVTKVEKEKNRYKFDRQQEYPSIQELVVALYDADDKAEIDKKRAEIKKKYPKPE
tara:strand:- start:32 stop:280 length:249 start_codon:yes stop_codon:yes gene_type:complete